MSEHADLVAAALRAAEETGKDVADVPLVAIARQAGISRSTLLRRLGGTRGPLDEAVRAAGVDPGGRRPVRERAVEAAARLIGERGLAAVTLEAVAGAADCSVPSVYAAFGGRTELLRAVFERYAPAVQVERLLADPDADLRATVVAVYRELARALLAEPRVLPAMIAQTLARPRADRAPAADRAPGFLGDGLRRWMTAQVEAGRLRGDLTVPELLQQMAGPLLLNLMLRPAAERPAPSDVDRTCEVFADAFLRAAAPPAEDSGPASAHVG